MHSRTNKKRQTLISFSRLSRFWSDLMIPFFFTSLFAHDIQLLLYAVFRFDIPKSHSRWCLTDFCCSYIYYCRFVSFYCQCWFFFSSHTIWVLFSFYRQLFHPFVVLLVGFPRSNRFLFSFFFNLYVYLFAVVSPSLCVRSKSGGIIYTRTHTHSKEK